MLHINLIKNPESSKIETPATYQTACLNIPFEEEQRKKIKASYSWLFKT